MARLASKLLVAALVRRVHDAGGSAMVLARGEAMGGAILLLLLERGTHARFRERMVGHDGVPTLVAAGPDDPDAETATAYWQRRRRGDPDLWVIEVDVAQAERFAAETILDG